MDKKDELYRGVIADLIAGHDKEGNINVSDEDWEIIGTNQKMKFVKERKNG